MSDRTRPSATEKQLVVFSLGREEFAVDVAQVREIIRMEEITRMPKSPPFVEGIINLRGQIIAVIDLAKRLNMNPSERTEADRIVVVETEDLKVGMIVDSVSEVMSVTEEEIEPPPTLASDAASPYILGVVKRDKRLIILLDLSRLLSLEEISEMSF